MLFGRTRHQERRSDWGRLRSEAFVRGLPNLNERDLQRVLAANSIYDNGYVLILALLSVGAKVVIENPSRSWLWSFPEYQQLLQLGLFDVEPDEVFHLPYPPSSSNTTTTASSSYDPLGFECHCDSFAVMQGLCPDYLGPELWLSGGTVVNSYDLRVASHCSCGGGGCLRFQIMKLEVRIVLSLLKHICVLLIFCVSVNEYQ